MWPESKEHPGRQKNSRILNNKVAPTASSGGFVVWYERRKDVMRDSIFFVCVCTEKLEG